MSFIHQSVSNKIVWFDEVVSTNVEARRIALVGAADQTIVAARRQNGGRGRRGRSWVSEDGGAWFSMILRPATPPKYFQRVSLIAALSACYAANDFLYKTGKAARIKWPNDIIVGGKKLCGILLESFGDTIILGVGMNVLQNQMPRELEGIATSLKIEGAIEGAIESAAEESSITDVIDSFHKFFSRGYQAFAHQDEGFFWNAFRSTYSLSSETLGRRVLICENQNEFTAIARDIGEFGELIVEQEDGTRRAVFAADVTLRHSGA